MTRAAVLRNPAISAGIGQLARSIQTVAPSLGVELTPMNVHDASEIERAISVFARAPNGGLIVTGSASGRVSSRSACFAERGSQAAHGVLLPDACSSTGAA